MVWAQSFARDGAGAHDHESSAREFTDALYQKWGAANIQHMIDITEVDTEHFQTRPQARRITYHTLVVGAQFLTTVDELMTTTRSHIKLDHDQHIVTWTLPASQLVLASGAFRTLGRHDRRAITWGARSPPFFLFLQQLPPYSSPYGCWHLQGGVWIDPGHTVGWLDVSIEPTCWRFSPESIQ